MPKLFSVDDSNLDMCTFVDNVLNSFMIQWKSLFITISPEVSANVPKCGLAAVACVSKCGPLVVADFKITSSFTCSNHVKLWKT
jgi:hypothetical protein